jgi:hypothetical protein
MGWWSGDWEALVLDGSEGAKALLESSTAKLDLDDTPLVREYF